MFTFNELKNSTTQKLNWTLHLSNSINNIFYLDLFMGLVRISVTENIGGHCIFQIYGFNNLTCVGTDYPDTVSCANEALKYIDRVFNTKFADYDLVSSLITRAVALEDV